ncbi:flagellar hook-length control protein FliK [Methylobacterium terricola]|uniref:Flagellar hook-length control protein FliK n=2 Tax=Methylobacterium terricola TaxID=2583531 RepID=A0A5C4LBG6_9HYPH|nr:flagellar hook-length control protein FliK [Methylobacterium terricola]
MPVGQGGDASSEAEPAVTSEEAPDPARMADRLRQGEVGRHAPSPEARLMPQARLSQAGLSPEAGSTAASERRAEGPADPAGGAPASVHGAPPAPTALPAATLRQIADAVTTGAASLPDAASLRAGAAAAALSAAAQAEGPVRLMTLQLRPAELGQVLVRMRLQDGRLEMSLRAEREETADLLRRDGGLLSALVREAGYQPDLVTVQAGRVTGQETPPQGGQSLPDFAGGQPQQGGASPDQPARRTPGAPEEGGRRSMEQRDEAHHGDRDRGGLYL